MSIYNSMSVILFLDFLWTINYSWRTAWSNGYCYNIVTYRALKDIDKFLTSSTQELKAFDECDFFASGIEARGGVWPSRQLLGSSEPPLPWEDHARPSSMQDHQACKTIKHWRPSGPKSKVLRTRFLKDQEPTVQISGGREITSGFQGEWRCCGGDRWSGSWTLVAETLSWFYFNAWVKHGL